MAIDRFRGEYFFLSNMYPLMVPIRAEIGLLVPTSEHAYQSAKFLYPTTQRQVASLATGIETKNVAHELEANGAALRPDWAVAKVGVMSVIIRKKFSSNPDIAARLLATEDQELVEGNDWGDRFWGVDPIGSDNVLNHLGEILMEVRTELKTR